MPGDAHVENEMHSIMAIGLLEGMLSDLPADKEGVIGLPTAPQLLEMWKRALKITRTAAQLAAPTHEVVGTAIQSKNPPVEEPKESLPPAARPEPATDEEAVEAAVEEETERQASLADEEFASPEAQSNNLVKLKKCMIDGCPNMIPVQKSNGLCTAHEPQDELEDDIEIT
jgi:hypothetical protein